MTPEHKQKILAHLDEKLITLKDEYPIKFANLLEVLNCKRGVWPQDLISEIDKRLKEFKDGR